MKKFQYKIRTAIGELNEGTIEATDKSQAIISLQKDNNFLITLNEISEEKGDELNKDIHSYFTKISKKDILLFTWQLYILINTGAKLVEAIEIIHNEIKNPKLKNKIQNISLMVKRGESFSNALSKHTDVFDKVYIASIKAGEQSGSLSEILKRLSEKFEEQINLQKRIKTSLIYPVILTIVTFIGIIFILTFILPKFKEVFFYLGSFVPAYTLFLFKISDFTIKNYYSLILIFIIITAAIIIFKKRKIKIKFLNELKFKIPLLGTLYEKIYASNFFTTLSLLISNGVNIIPALEITKELSENSIFESLIGKIINDIKSGQKMKSALLKEKRINRLYSYLIGLGEESGTLNETLEKLSAHLSTEIRFALENIVTFIEPALIFVLGMIIVFIAISIFIPLTDLITAIRR